MSDYTGDMFDVQIDNVRCEIDGDCGSSAEDCDKEIMQGKVPTDDNNVVKKRKYLDDSYSEQCFHLPGIQLSLEPGGGGGTSIPVLDNVAFYREEENRRNCNTNMNPTFYNHKRNSYNKLRSITQEQIVKFYLLLDKYGSDLNKISQELNIDYKTVKYIFQNQSISNLFLLDKAMYTKYEITQNEVLFHLSCSAKKHKPWNQTILEVTGQTNVTGNIKDSTAHGITTAHGSITTAHDRKPTTAVDTDCILHVDHIANVADQNASSSLKQLTMDKRHKLLQKIIGAWKNT